MVGVGGVEGKDQEQLVISWSFYSLVNIYLGAGGDNLTLDLPVGRSIIIYSFFEPQAAPS